uniref:IQ motif containing N n=1 Tax=Prolemur simus TaxID=1328070 RepID=A0A8C8Y870_PROSS
FFFFLRQGPTLSPGLECSGVITAHCNLQLLGSSHPPASPLPVPGLQDNLGKGSPQPQHGPQKAKERLSRQLAEAKTAPRRIPRLRAVVESQAFKNILVDEMDMMLSRAATLIQANWRRYRLRQKLISQVTAAKAIQEAWRRFSMRRLLRSSRLMVKKVTAEEGDIPYHAPQQVRFQHQEENRPLCRHRMVSKETQFPSSDSLAPSTPRPAPLPQPREPVCRAAPQAPGVAFLPHQTVAIQFPCPVNLDTKCQPCLLTETVRSACLVHIEGDTVKTKHALSQVCPPAELTLTQLGTCSAKASSQLHLPTKVTKAPSLAHLVTCLSRVHSQSHLATGAMKFQSQAHLPTGLMKAQSQAQLVTDTAKCLFTAHQAADLTSKTQSQPLLAGPKASTQPCQHLGVLSTPPRAKPEDRLTQLQPHSHAPSKTSQGPCPVSPESQGMLVPMLASTVQPTCNIESWGDSGAERAQPSLPSQAAPCQEDVGPVDAGVAGGQSWNSAPARDPAPWETVCSQAAVDPRLSPELMVSMQTVEAILIRAVITIQAGTRGYLVRRTIRMWHVMATVIQTHWRGYRVRRNLARLYRAITLIQAAWRGYCTRRDNSRRRQMLLPVMWGGLRPRSVAASHQPCFQDRAARATSDHRCFQSCQPGVCSLCQSLSSGLGSPPSVVMLVGSNPRTCHMCGHTQLRRVVQGTGRGAPGHGSTLWSPVSPQNPRQLHRQNKAATSIQSAWRGFRIRRQMTEQQKAAKMVQATWRGHYTRNCLTTDALLGRTSPWAGLRHLHSRWPGV